MSLEVCQQPDLAGPPDGSVMERQHVLRIPVFHQNTVDVVRNDGRLVIEIRIKGVDLRAAFTFLYFSQKPTGMQIIQADYDNPAHREHLMKLLDLYSRDPMGQNAPMSHDHLEKAVDGMQQHGQFFSLISYAGDGQPAGIANCGVGYSTFKAAPIVNIHDIAVDPDFRNRGVGQQLLEAVEAKARELGCCKITLEVRADNAAARLYERFGFKDDDPPMYFRTKELA